MIPRDPVQIVEVGPRDGLQNLNGYVDTEKKLSLIKRLADSGLRKIELGSFVHPKAIPQFRDIKEVVGGVIGLKGVRFAALVPNLKGAQDAFQSGIREIVFVFSVSRSHNLNNVRRTREESLEELKKVMKLAWSNPESEVRVSLATSFGCAFEIKVRKDDVLDYIERVRELGSRKITLCDTVGFGNPRQIEDIVTTCMSRYPEIIFGVHFHDTRGLGLANALAAYESGIRTFESSIAGLGGCPFAPGASGNVATEDIVFMFNEMGVETGVDLHQLLGVCRYLKGILPDVYPTSALFRAGLPGQAGVISR